MDEYPECEKMQSVKEKSQELGFFLEWLKSRYELCEWKDETKEFFGDNDNDYVWSPEGYYPARVNIQDILADYFNIDLNKVAEEQSQILDELRKND